MRRRPADGRVRWHRNGLLASIRGRSSPAIFSSRCAGPNHDGHDHVARRSRTGAAAAVVDHEDVGGPDAHSVGDTLAALAAARRWAREALGRGSDWGYGTARERRRPRM